MNGETTNRVNSVLSYFNIFRVPNLIIIAVTLWIYATKVIYPTLTSHDILPNLSMKDFYLFVFLTSCIAAGGYLLNDLVDIQGDQYNQKRSYIRPGWEKRMALLAYAIITLSPIPFAYSLAAEIGHPKYLWYYFIVVVVLAIYNISLKRIALLGNIVVAFLCAGVLWMFLLGEQESLDQLRNISPVSYQRVWQLVLFYYVFAFVSNLCREIVKDIQDIPGDKHIGARTLPLVTGVEVARKVIFLILCVLLIFSIWWIIDYQQDWKILLAFNILVVLPNVNMLKTFFKSIPIADYPTISNHLKLWMITGIIFIFIASFTY